MSNKTHVANATKGDLWVTLTEDKLEIASFEVNPTTRSGKIVLRNRSIEQMVLVGWGLHTVFDRNWTSSYYITVVTEDSKALVKNKEIMTNRSVIVTPDAEVFESYYRTMWQSGKSDIWKDCYGNDFHHCRR